MRKFAILIMIFIIGMLSTTAFGSDDALPTHGYFLAPDASGVIQVWRLPMFGGEPEMLTQAQTDIHDFAIGYDGLGIAYGSAGKLWLQPIDGAVPRPEPVELTSLQSNDPAHLIFSPDGNYLAYSDSGIWLLKLDGASKPVEVIANVPLGMGDPEGRLYSPVQFLDADSLIVKIGVWEGQTTGILDLSTGTVDELALNIHTAALPLHDGQVLLYGNNGMVGETNLRIAPADDLNNSSVVIDLSMLTDFTVLFVEQAVEIEPGVVRVIGSTLGIDKVQAFYFDLDLASRTVVNDAVHVFDLLDNSVFAGEIAPDGSILVQYVEGKLGFYNLESSETMLVETPHAVSTFRWQPRLAE